MSASKRTSALTIILNAFKKMGFTNWFNNPILAIVFLAACLATILLIIELYFSTTDEYLHLQMVFWIWMTLFFSKLAESYAESKLKTDDFDLEKINFHSKVKKLKNINNIEEFTKISLSDVRSGDLLLLEQGDIVPLDGTIEKGMCYVNDSNITGELNHAFKSAESNDILIAGSIIESDDFIILKISFDKRISFFVRAQIIIKNIKRFASPSEIALQRLIMGLSILFLSVIFAVWSIAKYSGFDIPIIYLLDLIVILLPTTISGLQYAVIVFGRAKLQKVNIIVNDHASIDNAVDMDIVILDKTGTLTIGKRTIAEFEVIDNIIAKEDCMKYLLLSSIDDSTYEGISITKYAHKHIDTDYEPTTLDNYEYFPFFASNPISGCNYRGSEIRKGSVAAIAAYMGVPIKELPTEVLYITRSIAESHGTPLLLAFDKKIIGIIHLSDKLRKGIITQIRQIQSEGMRVIMLTGDNKLTASYISKKLGINEFYANATPEKKRNFIKDLQQEGHVVTMCGEGANDSLALAQADIGFTFEHGTDKNLLIPQNVISKRHDLSGLINLKRICKNIATRRGSLTVFSLASDIAKYFLIVPSLFITAFPPLAILNFMNFKSLEGVILASVMFNALVIFVLTIILFKNYTSPKSKYSLWGNIIVYGLGGIISPFIFIKLLEIFIYSVGLL